MNKKDLTIVALVTFCLTAALFMILPTRSRQNGYDPSIDANGDTRMLYQPRTASSAYMYVRPTTTTVAIKKTFTINVTFENLPSGDGGAVGCQFNLTWNPSILNCSSIQEVIFHTVTPPEAWDNINMIHLRKNSTGGYAEYAVAWYDVNAAISGGYAPISGNGTWATLNFTAISPGETNLYLEDAICGDKDAISIPLIRVNGTVTVKDVLFIDSVMHTPLTPGYDDVVAVSAMISAPGPGVDTAFLSYDAGGGWTNVSMNGAGDLFNANVPAQPYGVVVEYRIYANDTYGNRVESSVYSYTVGDFGPPQIVDVGLKPVSPAPYRPSNVTRQYEPTQILINATEPVNASGVAGIVLSYSANGLLWNASVPHNSTSGLWTIQIPGCDANTHVTFWIIATDNAGNSVQSSPYSFDVCPLISGDVDGNGVVNLLDAIILGMHFGEQYP